MGKVHARYTLIDYINGNIDDEIMILSGEMEKKLWKRNIQ